MCIAEILEIAGKTGITCVTLHVHDARIREERWQSSPTVRNCPAACRSHSGAPERTRRSIPIAPRQRLQIECRRILANSQDITPIAPTDPACRARSPPAFPVRPLRQHPDEQARICSTREVPERGMPTMKIGVGASPARAVTDGISPHQRSA